MCKNQHLHQLLKGVRQSTEELEESVKFVGELDAAKLQDEIKKRQEEYGAIGDANDDSFRLEMDIDDDEQRDELEAMGRSIGGDQSNSEAQCPPKVVLHEKEVKS